MITLKLDMLAAQRLQRLLKKRPMPPFDENELAISSLDYALHEALKNSHCEATNLQIYREHGDGYTRYVGDCIINGKKIELHSNWTEDFDNKK